MRGFGRVELHGLEQGEWARAIGAQLAYTPASLWLETVDRVPIVVKAGGGAFHGGWTWHGSDVNRRVQPRRSIVSHCMSSETRFRPHYVGYIYSRYKRFGDDSMDESFFPILWRGDGYRSPFIDPYVARQITWGEAVPA